jgi:chromosome segregation ATPase
MDFLNLIAEASAPLITESFLKWVVGGMSLAIAALAGYIKTVISEKQTWLHKQIEEAPAKREKMEAGIRGRYKEVIDQKDEEIDKLEKDLKEMQIERFQFLQAQIEDAKKQEKGLQELTSDYSDLIEEITPLLEEGVNVIEYYNTAVRSHKKKKRGDSNAG